MRIEAAATLAGLTRVLGAYERFVRQQRVPDDARADMHIALEEIASNVVRHGSRGGARRMTLTLTANRRVLQATIIDDGPAFDPLTVAPSVTGTPANERPIGGLGILLARHLTNCYYSRPKKTNRVRLRREYTE